MDSNPVSGENDKATENSDVLSEDWYPAPENYSPGISTEKWIELLKKTNIVSDRHLQMLKEIRDYGGKAACKELSDACGELPRPHPSSYIGRTVSLARRIAKATGCPIPPGDEGMSLWWPILYQGRFKRTERGQKLYVWKLRPELAAALEHLFQVEPNQFKQNYP